VICGWNSKSEIIVQEYRAVKGSMSNSPIVVIAQLEQEVSTQELGAKVYFLYDDFTRVAALEKAGIHRARTCIILADTSGGRSEQDADARTILAALTVEKLNPAVYTCAELLNRSYGTHLKMGHVNDYVVSGEYSAYMLAQAAMNRGLMGVFTELLTYQRGNEFYRLSLPAKWHGRTYLELFVDLKKTRNATLVAVHPVEGEMLVNPRDHTFAPGDEVVVIAQDEMTI
jgi:voltage-gated potassium channel